VESHAPAAWAARPGVRSHQARKLLDAPQDETMGDHTADGIYKLVRAYSAMLGLPPHLQGGLLTRVVAIL